ncbi:hypothetical protein, partial [Staphylococcus felis]
VDAPTHSSFQTKKHTSCMVSSPEAFPTISSVLLHVLIYVVLQYDALVTLVSHLMDTYLR